MVPLGSTPLVDRAGRRMVQMVFNRYQILRVKVLAAVMVTARETVETAVMAQQAEGAAAAALRSMAQRQATVDLVDLASSK